MDILAVEYLFARLETDINDPRDLWEDLLLWHTGIGAEAGEMERYLALRVSGTLYNKSRTSARLDLDILTSYIERRWQWESALHAPGLLDGGGDGRLPSPLRAVCQMRKSLRLWRQERDFVGALRAAKAAAVLDPVFKETVETLAKKITADYEQEMSIQASEHLSQNQEFKALLGNIKPQIEKLLSLGRADEALPVLRQLESLVPGEAIIKELMEKALAARQ
jgi:hypothetical protein